MPPPEPKRVVRRGLKSPPGRVARASKKTTSKDDAHQEENEVQVSLRQTSWILVSMLTFMQQSEGENSPPSKMNVETPRKRVQLRRGPATPSTSSAPKANLGPVSMSSPKKPTALNDMGTWIKKTVDVSDPIDDVYGLGPQALRALKNIPFEKDLQCQLHLPAISRASQVFGLRLLDEKIFAQTLDRIVDAHDRHRLQDAAEGWLAAHGISFGSQHSEAALGEGFEAWAGKPFAISESVDAIWGTGSLALAELKSLPADHEFSGWYFVPAITHAAQLIGLRLLGKDEFDKVMRLIHPSFLAPNIKRVSAAVDGWLENHSVVLNDREDHVAVSAQDEQEDLVPPMRVATLSAAEPMDLLRRLSRQGQSPEKKPVAEPSNLSPILASDSEESFSHETFMPAPEVSEPAVKLENDVPVEISPPLQTPPASVEASPVVEEGTPIENRIVDAAIAKGFKTSTGSRWFTLKATIAAALAGSTVFAGTSMIHANNTNVYELVVANVAPLLPPIDWPRANAVWQDLPIWEQMPVWQERLQNLPGLQAVASLANDRVVPVLKEARDAVTSSPTWEVLIESDIYHAAVHFVEEIPPETAASIKMAALASLFAFLLAGSSKRKVNKRKLEALVRDIVDVLEKEGQVNISALQQTLAKTPNVSRLSQSNWKTMRTIATKRFGVEVLRDREEIWMLAKKVEHVQITAATGSSAEEDVMFGGQEVSTMPSSEQRAESVWNAGLANRQRESIAPPL